MVSSALRRSSSSASFTHGSCSRMVRLDSRGEGQQRARQRRVILRQILVKRDLPLFQRHRHPQQGKAAGKRRQQPVQAVQKAALLGKPHLLDAPQLVLHRHAGGVPGEALVGEVRRHAQFQNTAAQIALQLGQGLVIQILHHEFRPASLRQREDAGAVGLVDVALGRSLHPVQGEEGVGHRLHIVHSPGEQQVVRVHQTRHHLEIAAGLAVVVEGHQRQMPRQIFLRRAQSHPLTVPCEGRDPLLLVEHPAYGVVRALEQPDGGAERLPGLAAADAEAGEGSHRHTRTPDCSSHTSAKPSPQMLMSRPMSKSR